MQPNASSNLKMRSFFGMNVAMDSGRRCPHYSYASGDVSERMISWKKTFTNSLVEAKGSENVHEKFAVAPKQNRTMRYGGKSRYIPNPGTHS